MRKKDSQAFRERPLVVGSTVMEPGGGTVCGMVYERKSGTGWGIGVRNPHTVCAACTGGRLYAAHIRSEAGKEPVET